MKISSLPTIALLAACLAFPIAAAAQTTTGFPIGDKSRVHTNLDLGVVYDTNPSREATATSDWRGTVRPGLFIDVPGESFMLKLGGKAAIDYFFGAGVSGDDVRFGGDVGVDMRAGSTKSIFGFELKDHLSRTPTFFPDVGSVGAQEYRFAQWYNIGNANFVLRPGGGALEFRLGYMNRLSLFDDLPQSQQHGVTFEAKLKFFPKTAAFFAADLSFFSAEQSQGGPDTLDSSPLNLLVGLRGQLTPHFSAEAAAGYGDALTWNGSYFSQLTDNNIRTAIARILMSFSFMTGSSVSVGYDRQIVPIIQLNSYRSDAVHLGLKIGVGPRLSFAGLGRYDFRNFQDGSKAQVFTGDIRAEYWFFDFLNASLVYQALLQNPDEPGAAPGNFLLEDFDRHQVLFTIGLRY